MRASSTLLALITSFIAALGGASVAGGAPVQAPVAPVVASSTASQAQAGPSVPVSDPARLEIPAIGLNVSVAGVGVDSTGAMAVPSPSSGDVGWYEDGTIPGQVGSAVVDAHVFAAFSNLHEVAAGDDVYVVDQNGQTLHFVVTAVKDYALATLSPLQIFTPTADRDLNLITCAGNLTPDHSTYDHRLIVYTTLVS